MSDPCFTLRIQLFNGAHEMCERCAKHSTIFVRCYDDHFSPNWDSAGRVRLTYEVSHAGEVIFPKGQLYGAIHGSSDGIAAREHVLAHIAMHPGDSSGVDDDFDDDFYEGYTAAQLEWLEAHGEALDMERMTRYCDENGNPRKDRS